MPAARHGWWHPCPRQRSPAGADGLLIEMHPSPCDAWCDADQALTPQELKDLMGTLGGIAKAIGRTL